MQSKFIAAIVVVLSGATTVLAQTKISGTIQCGKEGTTEQHTIEVGDRPNHTLMIDKGKCTWSKPFEIAGTQTKETIAAEFVEISGTKYRAEAYEISTWTNGDKSYVHARGSGILKNGVPTGAEGTWNFTGGTGKLKGIKGKGTYKAQGAADGTGTIEVEGEYELPK